jgi:8-oxo-dGTP pyrophosphatase MutT (NUDIX family)
VQITHSKTFVRILMKAKLERRGPSMLKPTTIKTRLEHRGRVIQVFTERLLYANGREYDIDLVRHPGAAAVVAVDDLERVCVVRQYRHGVEDFLWEIPAGKLDAGELPQDCARRELAEETGVQAKHWTSLGLFIPAPAIFSELIHLYLARDLEIGPAKPDADEDLELKWLSLEEAINLTMSGAWNDGKTALGLCRARYQLQM